MATDKLSSIDALSSDDRKIVCEALSMYLASATRSRKAARSDGVAAAFEIVESKISSLLARFR